MAKHLTDEQYELEEFFGIHFTEVGPKLVKQFKDATPGQSSKYTEAIMSEDNTLQTVLEAIREVTVQYRVGLAEPGGKSPVLPDWDMKEVQKAVDKYIGQHTDQLQMKTMYPSPFTQGMNRGQYNQKIHRKIVNEINEFRHPEWREAYAAGFASMIPAQMKEATEQFYHEKKQSDPVKEAVAVMGRPNLNKTRCPACSKMALEYTETQPGEGGVQPVPGAPTGVGVECASCHKQYKLRYCIWNGTQRTINYINVVN